MRHYFSKENRHWREEVIAGTRLQTLSDIHRREMAALERALLKRVEEAERLCKLVLFEQERARRQIFALGKEVAELREEVRGQRGMESGDGRMVGWVDVEDDGYDV